MSDLINNINIFSILAMKVSSSDNDTIIIQCESFEAGRKPFSLPRISMAEFDTGKSSIIESGLINTLNVGSDNQIAFNKLVSETKISVEQVKIFLAASKN